MKNRRGFTLAEMLIVIAILALIMSITIPNTANFAAFLEANRLDGAAEELFLLAQNHLAYAKSAHSYKILEDADTSLSTDGRAFFIVGDGEESALLPKELFSATGLSGRAVIVVDPQLLTVTDVYYSETFGIDDLKCLAAANDDVSNHQHIGYYGGDSDVLSKRENRLIPTITVDNGDELSVRISCDTVKQTWDSEYSAEVTFSCENGEYTKVIDNFYNDSPYATIIVDRITDDGESYFMRDFLSEFQQTNDEPLGPPDSLTISVRIYQKVGGQLNATSELTVKERAVTISPLFSIKNSSSVQISCVRHLNNLRFLSDSRDLHVIQTQDIDFLDAVFKPISTFSGTFDGNDKLIINPKIKAVEGCTGIFGTISGYVKNVHIVGNGGTAICGEIESCASVGVLCAIAENGSLIENCSASGISVDISSNESADVRVGGLVGEAKGRISHCSTSCDISVSGEVSAKIGGIAGELSGGKIDYSHSAGRLSLSGNGATSQVCGISYGSGEVSDCFSECSVGYISGAKYYSVSSPEGSADNCFFLSENDWLADDTESALSYDELCALEISGFAPADFTCFDSEIISKACPFPESVTVNGRPTRFGETQMAVPRGLAGIAKVEYSSGEYINNVLACFDAYGNDSNQSPNISWDDPQDGEVRYYLYRSVGAYPEKAAPSGWNCLFSAPAELSEEQLCGRYICQQISLSEVEIDAVLSFGDISKTVPLSGSHAETTKLEKIGVAVVVNRVEFEYWGDEEVIEEIFDFYCCLYDPVLDLYDLQYLCYTVDEVEYMDLGGVTFDRVSHENEWGDYSDEIRIYVFVNRDAEDFPPDNELFAPPVTVGRFSYHEWQGEWRSDDEFAVSVNLPDGRILEIPITITMYGDWVDDVRISSGVVY